MDLGSLNLKETLPSGTIYECAENCPKQSKTTYVIWNLWLMYINAMFNVDHIYRIYYFQNINFQTVRCGLFWLSLLLVANGGMN